jgi:hypothetical protein
VECAEPNADLYKFDSTLQLSNSEEKLSLSEKQLLYQGSFLKNTDWVYALAVYTGEENLIDRD